MTAVLLLIISLTMYSVFFTKYDEEVSVVAKKFGVDNRLVLAVIKVESGFDIKAISEKGAVGLMQLKPATAKWIYEDILKLGYFNYELLYSAEINILLGVKYLDYLIEKFDFEFGLAAYNAGEGTIKQWLADGIKRVEDIPYDETRKYVARVKKFYKLYRFK